MKQFRVVIYLNAHEKTMQVSGNKSFILSESESKRYFLGSLRYWKKRIKELKKYYKLNENQWFNDRDAL